MTRPTDDGLQVIDFTGLQIGNADLADSCTWSPPQGEPERPLLAGEEHLAGLRDYEPLPKALPWLSERLTFSLCAVMTVAGVYLGGFA